MRRSISLWLAGAMMFSASTAMAQTPDPPGTYVVSVCRVQGKPIPLVGWRKLDVGSSFFRDTCGTVGGYFGFSANRLGPVPPSPFVIAWRWDAPADLRLAGLRSEALGGGREFIVSVRVDGRRASLGEYLANQPRDSYWRELKGLNASNLTLELSCDMPDDVECVADSSGSHMEVRQIDLVLRDEVVPSVSRSDLSAISASAPISGTVRMATDFNDRGGGLAGAELLVDGVLHKRVSTGAASCAKPYVVAVPCPTAGRVIVDFDTTTLPNGVHNLELRLLDAGGNRASVGPRTALVQNTLPATPGAVIPGRVSLRGSTLRGNYGTKVRIEGVVNGLDDAPLAGATVEVASRVKSAGAAFSLAAPAVTDASGRFSIPVPPGPSRTFRIRYGVSEATAEIAVRAPLRLRVTPSKTRNGRSIKFNGSIVGATAPGVRIELQARAGKRWVPFRTASLRNTRFSARYRFTNTTERTRYSFRAVVRADPDLPYAANVSKTVRVLVRP